MGEAVYRVGERWEPEPRFRTADGDHSVLIPPTAGTVTDNTWTSVFPPGALDRAGIWQPNWCGADWVLSIPAAWRAATIVAGSVSVMNLGAFRGLRPLPTPAVLAEPNPGEARATTVAAWVRDLLLHGNCFGVLSDRDSRGYVTSVVPVPPEDVNVVRQNGRMRYLIGPPDQHPDLRLNLDREQVLHVKGYSRSGDLRGQGVVEHHARTVASIQATDDYARRSFIDAGVPSGLIKVDPSVTGSQEKAAAIKTQWMGTFSGKREPAVLFGGHDFTPLAWNPSDMEMTATRNMSVLDVARMFGVPAFWLDGEVGGTSLTYQNIQDAAIGFVRFTLEFWVTLLEAELSRLLPRGTDCRFNRDNLLRADMKTRYETYEIGVRSGVLLVEEARADESLMPLGEAETIVADGPPTAEPVSPLPGTAADQQSNAQAA